VPAFRPKASLTYYWIYYFVIPQFFFDPIAELILQNSNQLIFGYPAPLQKTLFFFLTTFLIRLCSMAVLIGLNEKMMTIFTTVRAKSYRQALKRKTNAE
jgi:hypothetical protein